MSVLLLDAILETCAIFMLIIMFWALLTEKKDTANVEGYLIFLFESVIILLLVNVISSSLQAFSSDKSNVRVFNFLSYLLVALSIYIYACYCYSFINNIQKTKRRVLYIVIALCFFGVLGRFIFNFSDLIIIVHEDGSIEPGSLYYLFTGILILAALIPCIYMAAYYKILGKAFSIAFVFFGMFPITLIPLEIVWDATPVYLGMAFSLEVIYTMVHVEQSVKNVRQEKIIAEQANIITESQTRIMISQMQPHFMYNVLNSIYFLCEIDSEKAQMAVDTFASYLRMNMDAMGKSDLVPFTTELNHVEKYLTLEKMRFDDILNIEYDIKTTAFKLPVLTLQPLVENAVKHGICKSEDGGTVTIGTKEMARYFVISIDDNGVGFDVNSAPKDDGRSHVGLNSVTKRLELMCNAKIEYSSKIGVGTTVTIIIPKENV